LTAKTRQDRILATTRQTAAEETANHVRPIINAADCI